MLFLTKVAGLDKLDNAGNTLLIICRRVGFWIVTIKAIYDIIQCAMKGDRHALGSTVLTYVIIYAAMYFVPWALRLIEVIF